MAKAIIQQQVDELREDAGKLREDTDFLDAFRKSLIGVPITFVAQKVPDAFMICDGPLILFEDWPEFYEVYRAGKFNGMVLDTADSAKVGKFVKKDTTGLYLPDLTGLFVQASASGTAGAYVAAGLPNIQGGLQSGSATGATLWEHSLDFGALSSVQNTKNYAAASSNSTGYFDITFSAADYNPIYSDSVTTVQPPAVQYVMAMYLGKPAAAA